MDPVSTVKCPGVEAMYIVYFFSSGSDDEPEGKKQKIHENSSPIPIVFYMVYTARTFDIICIIEYACWSGRDLEKWVKIKMFGSMCKKKKESCSEEN